MLAIAIHVACGEPPTAPPELDAGAFVDVARQAGIEFVHRAGRSPELHMPEVIGGGVAVLDFDRDGDLDLYLVQSGSLEEGGGRPGDRLLRNDSAGGALRFTDVTAKSGIEGVGYGMGALVGDVDGDGFPDLYVTHFGPNRLWRNRGDGTFEDTSEASGTADPRWSVAGSFLDYDRDGDLDLFVANYVAYSVTAPPECFGPRTTRDYCSPASSRSQADRLYENRGDGTFLDISARAGIAALEAPALGTLVL